MHFAYIGKEKSCIIFAYTYFTFMPGPKKKQLPPLSIRVQPALAERIKQVAEIMGKPESELIRDCISIGLERLKQIKYDVAGAILDASEKRPPSPSSFVYPSPTQESASRLNETPPEPTESTILSPAPALSKTQKRRRKTDPKK